MRWLQDDDWSEGTVTRDVPRRAGPQRVRVVPATSAAAAVAPSSFRFQQFHVDVARNSSDDFNPLHDPNKWSSVYGNPYGSPVVSAFQMECLIEYLVRKGLSPTESKIIQRRNLRFCNYHFSFTGCLRAEDEFQVRVQPPTLGAGQMLSNRAFVSKGGKLIMAGSVRRSASPLYLPAVDFARLPGLGRQADITYVPDTPYFLKRKYLSTGNAKNFVIGSMVDQAYYFDEVEDRVNFPDMVPVSFISSALFEKTAADNVDFRHRPMVYARHRISVDQHLARDLRSNDRLHLLVAGPVKLPPAAALRQLQVPAQRYDCFGLVRDNQPLFRAQAFLVPLAAVQC